VNECKSKYLGGRDKHAKHLHAAFDEAGAAVGTRRLGWRIAAWALAGLPGRHYFRAVAHIRHGIVGNRCRMILRGHVQMGAR
jgi:hypothetical protein